MLLTVGDARRDVFGCVHHWAREPQDRIQVSGMKPSSLKLCVDVTCVS